MKGSVNDMAELTLTKSQIDNLMEFLELELIPSIRRDEDADNINYLVDMCDIYKKLEEAKAGE